jgi:hypothetical protein
VADLSLACAALHAYHNHLIIGTREERLLYYWTASGVIAVCQTRGIRVGGKGVWPGVKGVAVVGGTYTPDTFTCTLTTFSFVLLPLVKPTTGVTAAYQVEPGRWKEASEMDGAVASLAASEDGSLLLAAYGGGRLELLSR